MRKKRESSSAGSGSLGAPRQLPENVETLEEIAASLKMKPAQIYELCRSRCSFPIPYFKAGKALRFSRQEVALWLIQKK
jgi:predicted DNA-binding transcriptional regulator AlpA